MSVHFRNKCMPCQEVICNVPCETKRNRIQPYLVMRGYASNVRYENDTVIIE